MSQAKPALTVLVVLILIIGGVYFYKYRGPKLTKENVEVLQTDLTKEVGAAAIPAGMPADIPVNLNYITESYSAEYNDHRIILSTLSYKTEDTKDELWTRYIKYLEDNKFAIKEKNEETGYIFAENLVDTFSVVISESGELRFVQMSYTAKKAQ